MFLINIKHDLLTGPRINVGEQMVFILQQEFLAYQWVFTCFCPFAVEQSARAHIPGCGAEGHGRELGIPLVAI